MIDGNASLKPLTLADFDFEVPSCQIAQEPSGQRDGSRLLVRRRDGAIEHRAIRDLATVLPRDSLVVVNNTQVFASRLFGKLPSGGRVELFLLERPRRLREDGHAEVQALGRPLRKLKPGSRIELAGGLEASVLERDAEAASLKLRFACSNDELLAWLARWGKVPLPPYIERRGSAEEQGERDRERYQTVYAAHLGSVAAPTAGLHFTPTLLADLAARGIETVPLTLHVGAGTFLPVKTNHLAEHRMHEEEFLVEGASLKKILAAKAAKRKIVVVGTTSLRSLESLMLLAREQGCGLEDLTDRWQRTRLFIYPQHRHDTYKPWSADIVMTNFHQPASTLFMLVCALIGYDAARETYATAVAAGYRFYSYGDASILEL